MKKGFTLIEILVVVTIIGILATIGITSYSGLTQKTQDVKKKADINALANAYELKYNAKDKLYQPLTAADFSGSIPDSLSYSGLLESSAAVFRICANLASDTQSCSDPSPTCYCKESAYGGLALLPGSSSLPLASTTPTPTSTPVPTPTPTAKRVFITRLPSKGNLGGLAGADQICLAKAGNAGLAGTWKAWLSTDTVSAADRLIRTASYKRIDGVAVALNWADLTDGTLLAPIRIDETGQDIGGGRQVWTATQRTGLFGTGGSDCNDWTSDSSGVYAYYGLSDYATSWWTYYTLMGSSSCSQSKSLYCFEQDDPLPPPSPTPTPSPTLLPQSPDYKRVFVTGTTHNGNFGGLSGADQICQGIIDARGFGGTWKAWLSDSAKSPASQSDSDIWTQATLPYKLINGTTIALNWTDLTDGTLLTRINADEFLNTISTATGVWTGTQFSGAGGLQNCSSWTGASSGRIGILTNVNSAWTNSGNSPSCSETHRLYCFEQ